MNIDEYIEWLSQETKLPEYMRMSHPKASRIQFHLLAEQQRIHRQMLERRGKELMELEITGDSPEPEVPVKYPYKVARCSDGHNHNIHVHDTPLIVGKVYNFQFANHHHDGCYTITAEHQHEALHAWPVSGPHDTCAECVA